MLTGVNCLVQRFSVQRLDNSKNKPDAMSKDGAEQPAARYQQSMARTLEPLNPEPLNLVN
jgi:hypothetical protein